MVFPTQEAYRSYLDEHPNADPKNHSVQEKPAEAKSEGSGDKAPSTDDVVSPKSVETMLTKHKAGISKAVKSMKKEVAVFDQEVEDSYNPDSLFAKTYKKMPEAQRAMHAAGYKIGEYFEKHVLTDKATHEKYMQGWLEDSDGPEGVELQGALEALGVKGDRSPGDEKKSDRVKALREKGAKNEKLKAYVKEVVSFTQAALKELGIKELTLYRGVEGQGIDKAEQGDEVPLKTRELSSFSFDAGSAKTFGRVVEMKVPADKVFASVLTFPNFTPHSVSNDYSGDSEVLVFGASNMKGKVMEGSPKTAARRLALAYRALLGVAVLLISSLASAQECPNGTCVPPEDMQKFVTVLKEKKCLQTEKPVYDLDPVNIVVDRDGRIFYSGAAPHPYKLHMKWCGYDVAAEGKVNVLAAVQEPPSGGFRFRPKAYAGYLIAEPFLKGKKASDGIDAGLMADVLYFHDFNLNVHVGFRSFGGGLGLDIFRSFGVYAGYALAWDGFQSNPEAATWFAFW